MHGLLFSCAFCSMFGLSSVEKQLNWSSSFDYSPTFSVVCNLLHSMYLYLVILNFNLNLEMIELHLKKIHVKIIWQMFLLSLELFHNFISSWLKGIWISLKGQQNSNKTSFCFSVSTFLILSPLLGCPQYLLMSLFFLCISTIISNQLLVTYDFEIATNLVTFEFDTCRCCMHPTLDSPVLHLQ